MSPLSSSETPAESRIESRALKPRSRALPSPKAVVGGVLVAIAGLGTYATASGAIGANQQTVVVAAVDLAPGQALSPANLIVTEADLPPGLAANVARNVNQLQDTVVLGPVQKGEVIQAGNVVGRGDAQRRPEVSISLPGARAGAGQLKAGESVDVMRTVNNDVDAATTAVRNARIVAISSGEAAVGSRGDTVVTLSVNDRGEAAALVAAADSDRITLVRTTGIDR